MPNVIQPLPARRFQATDQGLSAEMLTAFEDDGYLLLENFIPADECDRLRARALELVETFDPDSHRTIFSTKTPTHAKDEYFRESGDKVHFFFEEHAFDEAGRLKQPKALSINKIGHALHDLDPTFHAFSRSQPIRKIAACLAMKRPLLLQSMYIFKQPRIGGEVDWHVDSTYLYTNPPSCIGFWFALEDACVENGAMCCLPGAHHDPLRMRFVRRGNELVMEKLDPSPWPVGPIVSLEASKGSAVLLHGQLPHRSNANTSNRSRHAYTLHLIDGALEYPLDNWLIRPPTFPLHGFDWNF